jgi:hypothetical protein
VLVGVAIKARVGSRDTVGATVGVAEGASVGVDKDVAVGVVDGIRMGVAVADTVGEIDGVAIARATDASLGVQVRTPNPMTMQASPSRITPSASPPRLSGGVEALSMFPHGTVFRTLDHYTIRKAGRQKCLWPALFCLAVVQPR